MVCLEQLKSAQVATAHSFAPGHAVTFVLLQRRKGEAVVLPRAEWTPERARQFPPADAAEGGGGGSGGFSRLCLLPDPRGVVGREGVALRAFAAAQARDPQGAEAAQWAEVALALLPDRPLPPPSGPPGSLRLSAPEGEGERTEGGAGSAWDSPPSSPRRPPVGEVPEGDETEEKKERQEKREGKEGGKGKGKERGGLRAEAAEFRPSEGALRGETLAASGAGALQPAEFFFFFQEIGGQPIFLHPQDVQRLLERHGAHWRFPNTLTGRVRELTELTIDQAARRRYKFLDFLPLSSTVFFCKIDHGPPVSASPPVPVPDPVPELEAALRALRLQEEEEKKRKEAEAKEAAEREAFPPTPSLPPSFSSPQSPPLAPSPPEAEETGEEAKGPGTFAAALLAPSRPQVPTGKKGKRQRQAKQVQFFSTSAQRKYN
jgi:hypothetical protein